MISLSEEKNIKEPICKFENIYKNKFYKLYLLIISN